MKNLIKVLLTVFLFNIMPVHYGAEQVTGLHLLKTLNHETICLWNEKECNVEILVPEKSPDILTFAAKELKNILDKSGNININIVNKESDSKQTVIALGCEAAEHAGIKIPALPLDGFMIKTIKKDNKNFIFIAGHDSTKAKNIEYRLKTVDLVPKTMKGPLFLVYTISLNVLPGSDSISPARKAQLSQKQKYF